MAVRPLDAWNSGFESHWQHGCSSLVLVACWVGSGLYNELITHPEEPIGCVCVWCAVCVCGVVWCVCVVCVCVVCGKDRSYYQVMIRLRRINISYHILQENNLHQLARKDKRAVANHELMQTASDISLRRLYVEYLSNLAHSFIR